MPTKPFEIVDVSSWNCLVDETRGSKRKFWLISREGTPWLFKYRYRTDVGDDWSEVVSAELAGALGVPHAHCELSVRHGEHGVISRDFTKNRQEGDFVAGNELLTEIDPTYPGRRRYRVAAHTIERVFQVLQQNFIQAPAELQMQGLNPSEVFLGYLLLDALIGNTDRHHENWGVLQLEGSPRRAILAPSFDHASSLGRNLRDDAKKAPRD